MTRRGGGPRARACTPGASGAAASSSTGRRPRGRRSPTPGSTGGTSARSSARTPCAAAIPGYVAGATFAQALGWQGARVTSVYAACASGAQAIGTARAQILAGLADVVLVVGADSAPEGVLRAGRRRPARRSGLAALPGARGHQPGVLRAVRAAPDGRARGHPGGLRAGQGEERRGRARSTRTPATASAVTAEEVAASAVVADPLRLLDICATSDGGAALVLSSMDFARRHGVADPVRIRAVSTVTPTLSADGAGPAGHRHRLGGGGGAAGRSPSGRRSRGRRTRRRGSGPEDLSLAEVYDLSTALELEWYEDIGLCGEGEGAKLLREGATALGRAHTGQHQRRAGLLRGGGAGAGHRPGVRADLAVAGRRPGSGRCRGRGSGSPPTRGCSGTGRRSSPCAEQRVLSERLTAPGGGFTLAPQSRADRDPGTPRESCGPYPSRRGYGSPPCRARRAGPVAGPRTDR